MRKDKRGGFEVQRAFHNLARVNRGAVDCALAEHFIGDEAVLSVQKQNAKLFHAFKLHSATAIIEQRRPRREYRPSEHAFLAEFGRGGFNDLQIKRGLGTNAFDLCETVSWRGADFGKATKFFNKRFRHRFHISLRNGVE